MYNVKVPNLLYIFSIVFQIPTKNNFVFIKKNSKKIICSPKFTKCIFKIKNIIFYSLE